MKEAPLQKLKRQMNESPMKQLGTHKSFKKARTKALESKKEKTGHLTEAQQSRERREHPSRSTEARQRGRGSESYDYDNER